MGTTDRNGVPVLLLGEPGLLLHVPDQVRDGVASLLPLLLVDAAGEGHRLEVDAADHITVLDGEADDVADLVVIEPLDQGRDEDDRWAVLLELADVLDGL